MKILLLLTLSSIYPPEQSFKYRDNIYDEITRFFYDLPNYNYIPALIDHETCYSYKDRRCWNPQTRFKTAREEGAGLGQITKAYREDGTLRFDNLKEMRERYIEHLRELTWETVYLRPDLQIRAIVLNVKDLYSSLYMISDPHIRLHFVDAAYNGGLRNLLNERRACSLSPECDPDIWFNNVENHCLKSKNPLYGKRSACDINRHHVRDVFKVRLPRYEKTYFTPQYLRKMSLVKNNMVIR